MALNENEVIIRAGDLDGASAPWLYFFCEVKSEIGRGSYDGMGLGGGTWWLSLGERVHMRSCISHPQRNYYALISCSTGLPWWMNLEIGSCQTGIRDRQAEMRLRVMSQE